VERGRSRQAGDLERAYEVLLEGIDRHPDHPSAQIVTAGVPRDIGGPGDLARIAGPVAGQRTYTWIVSVAPGSMGRWSGPDQ
jgi:hypothetical protein